MKTANRKTFALILAGIVLVYAAGCIHLTNEDSHPNGSEATIDTETQKQLSPTNRNTQTSVNNVTSEPDQPRNSTSTPSPIGFSPFADGVFFVMDQFLYGTYELIPKRQTVYEPLEPLADDAPGPSNAKAFRFSNYNEKIAYLHESDGKEQLWVSDLRLNFPHKVWQDDHDDIKFNPQQYEEIKIRWGPNDQSLFLSYENTILLIRLSDPIYLVLDGICEWIGISPKTELWALWCPTESDKKKLYAVVEQDGNFWITPFLPQKNGQKIIDWSFSPDQKMVLYADPKGKVMLSEVSGKPLDMGLSYEPPLPDTTMQVLQWSQDGSKVFLYVHDKNGQACPIDDTFVMPCWVIVDKKSNEIVWPSKSQEIVSGTESILSPDGKWIAKNTLDTSGIVDRYVEIISLEDNRAYKISTWQVRAMFWAK